MKEDIRGKISLFVVKHLPTILSFVGCVGVVSTSVLSAKAAVKAERLIKDEGFETPKEIIKASLPIYIPTIISGGITIASILAANSLHIKRELGMLAAHAFLLSKYQFEKDGSENALTQEKKDIFKEQEFEVSRFIDESDSEEKMLFYEEYRGGYFESTKKLVLEAQYHLNRNLALRGYTNLSEFYDFLGLSKLDSKEQLIFDSLGWSFDVGFDFGYSWVDFNWEEVDIGDGTICVHISYPFEPTVGYIN